MLGFMISSICFCGINAFMPLYTMHTDLILPPNESQYNTRSLSPSRDQVRPRSFASLARVYPHVHAHTHTAHSHTPSTFSLAPTHVTSKFFWLCVPGSACSAAKLQSQESLRTLSQYYTLSQYVRLPLFTQEPHQIQVCLMSPEQAGLFRFSLFKLFLLTEEKKKSDISPPDRHTHIPLLFSIRQNPIQTI